jgi:hypothetical protein
MDFIHVRRLRLGVATVLAEALLTRPTPVRGAVHVEVEVAILAEEPLPGWDLLVRVRIAPVLITDGSVLIVCAHPATLIA